MIKLRLAFIAYVIIIKCLFLYIISLKGPCKSRNIGRDFDCDGWVDSCDNCPHVYNPDQMFAKNHNVGVCCDSDPDEDGHSK